MFNEAWWVIVGGWNACNNVIWLVVLTYNHLEKIVNGKDDIPYMKWKMIHSCSKPPTSNKPLLGVTVWESWLNPNDSVVNHTHPTRRWASGFFPTKTMGSSLWKKVVNSKTAFFWVNYNISLTWIKAIWGWFPLLTMIPVRSQWGRYNLPSFLSLEPC